jgi:hypothetical protein
MASTFDENLKKRMAECWQSELDPEMVTPNTAGAEEEPYKEEVFTLTRQFRQSNMGSRPQSINTNRGGKKADE